ncbi:MAG: family 43 glycosylhydrolase [Tannerella sp.]|nr:family 43 glycosylhydrolase [Tannerella sp.]
MSSINSMSSMSITKIMQIKVYLLVAGLLFTGCSEKPADKAMLSGSIVANPMNLAYRFHYQDNDPARREAADPVCEYFKGKYYLFASKSGGYWSSPDLAEWTYIPCKSMEIMDNYAPTILILDDEMYYMASWDAKKIYRNANPDKDEWQLIDSKFEFTGPGTQDPAWFRDDDGSVYFYCGCSNTNPVWGVQVDPADGFKVISETKLLIPHSAKDYGWENPGNNNEQDKEGWNEGPCMIKYKGKYYLQYAAPGTEFRTYADGVYVSDNPLGTFTYMDNSPFSFKPGGFVAGAGHGHTFLDKYGNYWHVASMKIAKRHWFERRLGLFPLGIAKDGKIRQQSVWSDYPFVAPDHQTDFETTDFSAGWNLLSYRKPATASSTLDGYGVELAFNEEIETWWSAETGNAGEWLTVDLIKTMDVRAIQVNLADQDFVMRAPHPLFSYQYYIEASSDGNRWTRIVDKTANEKDAVHELLVLDKPVETRYLRITNTKDLPGKFSLYGFRVFGNGKGDLPKEVTGLQITRNEDKRRFALRWDKQDNVTGYIVNVGLKDGAVNQSVMVFDNQYEAGFFNRDSEYRFTVTAFNENGVFNRIGTGAQ